MTRIWMTSAIEKIQSLIDSSNQSDSENENSPKKSKPEISPALVLTHAYLALLDAEPGFIFPEVSKMFYYTRHTFISLNSWRCFLVF